MATCTQVDHIRLIAGAGSHIAAAIREAVALAFTENRDVVLAFNDNEYLVDVAAIVDSIIGEAKRGISSAAV